MKLKVDGLTKKQNRQLRRMVEQIYMNMSCDELIPPMEKAIKKALKDLIVHSNNGTVKRFQKFGCVPRSSVWLYMDGSKIKKTFENREEFKKEYEYALESMIKKKYVHVGYLNKKKTGVTGVRKEMISLEKNEYLDTLIKK